MRLRLFLLLALLSSSLFAAAPLAAVNQSLSALCQGLTSILPVVAMLMVVLGAVIYAAGQIMGAETRARANVWATAALTGAMMAMLFVSIAPSILQYFSPTPVSCTAGEACPGGCPSGQVCCQACGATCMTPAACNNVLPC